MNGSRFLVLVSFLLNLFFFLDPTDSYYGFGYYNAFVPLAILFFSWRGRGVAAVSVWSLFLLAFFLSSAVMGSYYAIVNDLQLGRSFMRIGLLGVSYFLYKDFLSSKENFEWFSRLIKYAGIVALVVMFVALLVWRMGVDSLINRENGNLYHEEVYIFALLAFLPAKNSYIRKLIFFISVLCCLMTFKISGFLVAGVIIVYGIYVLRFRGENVAFLVKSYIPLIIFLVSLAGYFSYREIMPSGNADARLLTYGVRWAQFLSSPIWGHFFQIDSYIDVEWAIVPAHSDVLDVLASSGLVGFILLWGPFFKILSDKSSFSARYIQVTPVLISYLFVAMFNPVLMDPKNAYWVWCLLAYSSCQAVLGRSK